MNFITTKLYIPSPRPQVVLRPRLTARLSAGPGRKLTLISAAAGFGKTTLVAEWCASQQAPVAWLSLDPGDNDPVRFLTYLVAAVQTIAPEVGTGVLGSLRAPQPPPTDVILAALLNEIAARPGELVLVLDDYHAIDYKPIDHALLFLLEHLPPRMHLVILTREDPDLPLARLRARDQLTELRAADLRFTPAEAAEFLNRVMGLALSPRDIAALENRTEGWIAGLQLAALSMQGQPDTASFIKSFTGSHRFVLDYLVNEVLQQQPDHVQTFLLRTSILDRLCGPLCDAVLGDDAGSGQATLEQIERANLFIIPLDNERRWYRYHHLFAELLRQRLQQSLRASDGSQGGGAAALHRRAAVWYEANGLDLEAFQHAVTANDIEHAARLVEGKGMPLHFRGAAAPVLQWLATLPAAVLDARPSLWVIYASALLFFNQTHGVEEKLLAAEAVLQGVAQDEMIRDLVGHIAAIRATVAVTEHDAETILVQARRALEYLHPDNLPVRIATTWTLGYAYQLAGDRVAANRAYTETLSLSRAIGHHIITLMSALGVADMQELNNQLAPAAELYREFLQLAGDPPLPVACDGHLGLARIYYEWNDLETAQLHAQTSVLLARQISSTDRIVSCEVVIARLKLAHRDAVGASVILASAERLMRDRNFVHRTAEVVTAQIAVLLFQNKLQAAAELAQAHNLPLNHARVLLAQGDTGSALAVLEAYRREVEHKGWADELLRVLVLQAVSLQGHGETDCPVQVLGDALALAEPGGFVRTFTDEGPPMAQLLARAAAQGLMPDYVGRLLAVLATNDERQALEPAGSSVSPPPLDLIDPLSHREMEILQLVARGLSNREIGDRLFLALSTVKGYNRQIFDKLGVQRRTEAVARARELGLL